MEKSILERESFSEIIMGTGSANLQNNFQNNVKFEYLLTCITYHYPNTERIWRNLCQKQGWHDLQAFRQHYIRNSHHSVTEIPAWAQEHFKKSLSVKTAQGAIQGALWCKEEAINERAPETPPSSLGQSSFKID